MSQLSTQKILQLCCDLPFSFTLLINFPSLSSVLTPPLSLSLSFLSNLEGTQWLHYLCQLISVACDVVQTVHDKARPVLVHCSDGWDRTAQVVPLAELMLDPYYRTIEVCKIQCQCMYRIGERWRKRGRVSDAPLNCVYLYISNTVILSPITLDIIV